MTPVGVVNFPHLSKPDTKFSQPGDYKVNLILTQGEAAEMIEHINAAFAEHVESQIKIQKKTDIQVANPPYTDEIGDDGKPTGNVMFRLKSKFAPSIVDSNAVPMENTDIWAGSELRAAYNIGPYVAPNGVGVSLWISAVQVVKYVTASSGGGTFGKIEGYKQDQSEAFQEATPKVEEVKPELSVVKEPAVKEPAVKEPVVKSSGSSDNSKNISDIVNKWGAKN